MLGAAVAKEAEDPARHAGQLEGQAALFLSTEPSNLPKECVYILCSEDQNMNPANFLATSKVCLRGGHTFF